MAEVMEVLNKEGNAGLLRYITTIIFTHIANYQAAKFLEQRKNIYIKGTNLHRYVRKGYHKLRTIVLAIGIYITLALPRIEDRARKDGNGDIFYVSFCEKYNHSCQDVDDLALHLYLKGVAQDQISSIIYKLFNYKICGFKRSSISRKKDIWLNKYIKFQDTDLSIYNNHVLMIDATYIKVKNKPDKICLLSAIVVKQSGYSVIGWDVAESESEEAWSRLFDHFTGVQGMGQPRMVITDGGSGGLAAIKSRFPGALVQRCWVHKIRNILGLLPKKEYKTAIPLLKNIYMANNVEDEYQHYNIFINYYSKNNRITSCLTESINQLLTFHQVDEVESFRLYTTNVIESLFSVSKLKISRARVFLTA
ncbi:MAG: transposase [Deltaproteobacteria bacterium]|jgi:transposase-like protein|nr:transposase [Deltaproteobacteria bacterium]